MGTDHSPQGLDFVRSVAFLWNQLWASRHIYGSRGRWFNIKISYQNKKSHCGDKVIKLSDLYNGVSFTWYWNIPHMSMSNTSNIKGGKTLLLPFSEHIRENEYGWVYLHCRSVCKAAPLCRWSPVLLLNSVAIYITSVSQSMSLSIRVNFKTLILWQKWTLAKDKLYIQ